MTQTNDMHGMHVMAAMHAMHERNDELQDMHYTNEMIERYGTTDMTCTNRCNSC